MNTSSPQKQRPIEALIGGRVIRFATQQEKFAALAQECYRLRTPGSSTSGFLNDAYGQIVAMGWDAVPFLLREAQQHRGHWFTALTWITGFDPITPETRGNLREIRRAWMEWGSEHGEVRKAVHAHAT